MAKENKNKRTKLKTEREKRQQASMISKKKKATNREYFDLLTPENISTLSSTEKGEVIKTLSNLIISYPMANHDKLHLLFLFVCESNSKIVERAITAISSIFLNILPDYTGKNRFTNKANLSKEVAVTADFETNSFNRYKEFIEMLRNFTSNKIPQNVRLSVVTSLGQLLEKFTLLETAQIIIKTIGIKLVDPDQIIRQAAFDSFRTILEKPIIPGSDCKKWFVAKWQVIKFVVRMVKSNNHSKFDRNILDLLVFHQIEFPVYEKKKKQKLNKNKLKEVDKKLYKEAEREMKEVMEGERNEKLIFDQNLLIMKEILQCYFEILEDPKDGPLLAGVYDGVRKIAENINIEILSDIQTAIYNRLKRQVRRKGTMEGCISGLQCCLTISEKLTRDILPLDESNLKEITYIILRKCGELSKDEYLTILNMIEVLFLKNREFSNEILFAFVKQIAIFTTRVDKRAVYSFLIILAKLMDKYAQTKDMLYEDEIESDQFNYQTDDPRLAEGKQTTIVPEMKRLLEKFDDGNVKVLVSNVLAKDNKEKVLVTGDSYDMLTRCYSD